LLSRFKNGSYLAFKGLLGLGYSVGRGKGVLGVFGAFLGVITVYIGYLVYMNIKSDVDKKILVLYPS